MCTNGEGREYGVAGAATIVGAEDEEQFHAIAEALCSRPERRSGHVGFGGYGSTGAGDRILLGVDSQYDLRPVDSIVRALRRRGARVDIVIVDQGPNRPLDENDEILAAIRRVPFAQSPRRWEGFPWVERLAQAEGYDLLIMGKGGPTILTPHRYEQIPWLQAEHFLQQATAFPTDVHDLVNLKTWEKIWGPGRGGQVHLTDAEGTDLTYTLFEAYYHGRRRGFEPEPRFTYGHLFGHGMMPLIWEEDARGVIAGTTSHFSRAFPRIRLHLSGGRVEEIEGGGGYGEGWRNLLEETRDIQYPGFPRPGLFWLWEVAIGTNPKIARPRNVQSSSSGGFEWERRRSGVIHCGIGTYWKGYEELWAGERGYPYGHLHVHLLFPTYQIRTLDGEVLTLIENGRLTALDDPQVREAAARHGDPDEVLSEAWIPSIPGITEPGDYEHEYAADPGTYIDVQQTAEAHA